MPYTLNREEPKILDALENVAKLNNFKYFTGEKFEAEGVFSRHTVIREFGSWKKAMEELKKYLSSKKIEFNAKPNNFLYSNDDIFCEIERIWKEVGHRPSKDEWISCSPRISYDVIIRRFGGWISACSKFIEFKSTNSQVPIGEDSKRLSKATGSKNEVVKIPKFRTKTRNIPSGIRLKVLNRDNFSCIFCGKSPATDFGTKLHLDHIVPFSKGGTNKIENLQTLCSECNLGKGDSEKY